MISPSLIGAFIIAIAAAVTGALGYSYFKGNQACVASYQYKILQARVKNQEIALAYYKSANDNAISLTQEAQEQEKKALGRAKALEDEIKLFRGDGNVVITADFLRKLDSIRQQSISKNPRSANKRLSKGDGFKALDGPGVHQLLKDFVVNEDHNIRAILTARRFHKRMQEIYNSKKTLTGP